MVAQNSGLRSALSGLAGFIIPFATFVLVTPSLVSNLGVDSYGVLVALGSFVFLLSGLDFGLTTGCVYAVTKLLSKHEYESIIALLRELFTFFMGMASIIAVVAMFLSKDLLSLFHLNDLLPATSAKQVIYSTVGLFFLTMLVLPFSVLLQAKQQFQLIVGVQVFAFTMMWLGAWLIVEFHIGGVLEILCWHIIVQLFRIMYLVYANHKILPNMEWFPILSISKLKELLPYSGFMFLNQVSSLVVLHLDRFFLVTLSGPASVTYYAVAVTVSNKIMSLANAVAQFVFPRATHYSAVEDKEKLVGLYLIARRYVLLLVIPTFVPLFMYSQDILAIWMGSEFADKATMTMKILIVAYMLALLSVVPAQVFNGLGNTKIGGYFALGSMLVNVVLCILLIPEFGSEGAAIAALIAMSQAVIYMFVLEKELGVLQLCSDSCVLIKIIGVSILQFIIIVLYNSYLYWTLGLIVAWSSFYVIWFFLGFMSSQDKALLQRLARGVLGAHN